MVNDAGDAAGNVVNVDGKRCERLKKSSRVTKETMSFLLSQIAHVLI